MKASPKIGVKIINLKINSDKLLASNKVPAYTDPIKVLPESPINIFAGIQLKHKKEIKLINKKILFVESMKHRYDK